MSSERSVKDVFGPYMFCYGGEEGIRTPGTGFSQYNGLANFPFHSLLFGINNLCSG